MTIFYPFCMTSWEAILTKEVIVPSPTMSANVINKDNEGPAKKLIFPARRRLQSLALWFAVYGLLGLKSVAYLRDLPWWAAPTAGHPMCQNESFLSPDRYASLRQYGAEREWHRLVYA